jgi:hypothetical protein
VGKFTLIILWRNGTSGQEKGLSWPDVQDWMQNVWWTAGQDLIMQVLIVPDNAHEIFSNTEVAKIVAAA